MLLQNTMADLGFAELVMKLVASTSASGRPDVAVKALELGASLLDGGNTYVQHVFETLFRSASGGGAGAGAGGAAGALVGGGGGGGAAGSAGGLGRRFFAALRDRIRAFKHEVSLHMEETVLYFFCLGFLF